MAKLVGLSRAIKIEWLNKTAELLLEDKDKEQIKNELNEYLSYEIKSQTNLRKTREILMNLWINTPNALLSFRRCAIETFKTEGGNLAAHWGMLLVTYPIFADCCSLIGKLSNIQDTFTTSWLKDRLYEIWGERSTLYYSIGRILQTLKYLAVIEPIKPGVYKIKQRKLVSPEAIEVLLMAILLLKEKAYYGIPELTCLPKLFPFVFDVSHEWLHNSDVFKLASFGGKIVLTIE